jgi:hypothetical protein
MKKTYSLFVILVAVICLGSLSSCRFSCINGSGHRASENRKVADFTRIDISDIFKVTLKQDSSLAVNITADDNLLKYIKSSVSGGRLRIYTKKNFCNSGELLITIGVRNLEEIKASGAVDVASDGKINTRDLNLKLSGVSKINLDLNAANVRSEVSGVTELYLKGQASSHDVDLSGSGKISALDFVVGNYNIQTSGVGDCAINVLQSLSVNSKGASHIKYRGNPSSVSNHETGVSSIEKIN